jgi:hypothetical protein
MLYSWIVLSSIVGIHGQLILDQEFSVQCNEICITFSPILHIVTEVFRVEFLALGHMAIKKQCQTAQAFCPWNKNNRVWT